MRVLSISEGGGEDAPKLHCELETARAEYLGVGVEHRDGDFETDLDSPV